jgi:hypothetical protein
VSEQTSDEPPRAESPPTDEPAEPTAETSVESTDEAPAETPVEGTPEPAAPTPATIAQIVHERPVPSPPPHRVIAAPPEPAADVPVAPAIDEPAPPTADAPAEPAVETPAEPAVEPVAEPAVEGPAEPAIEPVAAAPAPPTADAPAEPAHEAPAETLAEPIAAAPAPPTADAPAEPAVEAPAPPTADVPAEAIPNATDPTAEPIADMPVAPTPTPATVASTVHEHPVPTPPAGGHPGGAPASTWGRVADDGTVFVRTAEGERSVGSYPGAAHDEALAYFGRKYDELEGQVALLEQRLAAGGVAPKDAATSIGHLREAVTDAHAVGDLDGLLARLGKLDGLVAERRKEADAARQAARREAQVLKERIVAEAETLRASTDWKRTGDRMRTLLDEWKAAARLDRKTDDTLWKRFSHARTSFDKNRRAHFAELDSQRSEAAERKEKLIAEAVELSTSTDWGPTARRYRDLMTEWKATGRARRDVEDELWNRFRAAQDTFFSARNEIFSTRDADLKANLEVKLALLAEAEALLPVTDARAARTTLRGLHERWEAAGHIPRGDKDAVEGRLRKVDDAVRAAEESQWKRSNPEARARAEATVGQLRTSIESLEAEATKAEAAGQPDKAANAREGAAARREWLAEAERTLAEFS